ncbi:MAG: hypothetical protein LBS76_04670 [Mycoplasmataceae bacterium]|nr:hypothetical protein [Mycoplasmataceae bacterium]
MYYIFETKFDKEFDILDISVQKQILSVMYKIKNNNGLLKGDFGNHLLEHGKYKGLFCLPSIS